jgi:hypothetical protein
MAISSPPRGGGQAAPYRERGVITALVVAIVIGMVLAGVGVALLVRGGSSTSGLRGSGLAATQSRALPGFSGVDLAGSNIVTVVVGGRQSVVVHADSNLIRNVTTRIEAGTLVIGTTGSFTTKAPMRVDVDVPSLAAVTLSGSGEISVSGIHAAQYTVTLSGSGVLSASGTATRLDVTVDGSGMARLGSLIAQDVHAVVSGSGLIRVTATTRLDASVPGSGAIVYGGSPPQVTTSVTGSGAITRG